MYIRLHTHTFTQTHMYVHTPAAFALAVVRAWGFDFWAKLAIAGMSLNISAYSIRRGWFNGSPRTAPGYTVRP